MTYELYEHDRVKKFFKKHKKDKSLLFKENSGFTFKLMFKKIKNESSKIMLLILV